MRHKRAIQISSGGLLSTVQDLGRSGVAWMGVSPSGAADWFSARSANRLVGNDDGAALIETTMNGISFVVESATRIAVTGAKSSISIDSGTRAMWRAHDVRDGETVVIGPAERGMRAYVAFHGGIDVPQALGSASTDVSAEFGGLGGRRLASGDELHLKPAEATGSLLALDPAEIPLWSSSASLSVLAGPHALRVGVHALHALCEGEYRVSATSSRQALRLEGQPLEIVGGTDIISEGVNAGCVQVTNDGLPVLLLSEHQTTGGYAVALCVCTADVPQAAQLSPGARIRFVRASYGEATAALDAMTRKLDQIAPLEATAKLGDGFFEGV